MRKLMFVSLASLWATLNLQASEITSITLTHEQDKTTKAESIDALHETAKIKSKQVFPSADITLGNLKEHYSPLFSEEVSPQFWPFIEPMFLTEDEFGKKPHPQEIIAQGWRCLYVKLYMARELYESSEEKVATYQLKALYQLLNLHRKAFDEKFPELGKRIPPIPGCAACHRSARIQQTGEYRTGNFDIRGFFDYRP